MNKIKKNITVHFFSIQADDAFFAGFDATFTEINEVRILRQKNKSILLKTLNKNESGQYFLTGVRERYTWQVKASREGKINEISTNQGVVGDPYFFVIIPDEKLIAGFTTGLSGSLKSVGTFLLEQFNSSSNKKIKMCLIPKDKNFQTLQDIVNIHSLEFKINASVLVDLPDNAPLLLKQLSDAPYIDSNLQLSLDLDYTDTLHDSNKEAIEIISYLSEQDIYNTLKVKGIDNCGQKIGLDFGNAFLNYKTDITVRAAIIDQNIAYMILRDALNNTLTLNSHQNSKHS